MKRTITATAFICLCTLLSAQSLQLKGRILSGKEPVEFANVVLQTPDSVFVTGGITDQRGRFNMNNLHAGNYCLQISCLGYEPRRIDLEGFNSSSDLGDITIDSSAIALDEVTVTAANVINQIDRKIILPTAYQLKASSNGLSLLQQMKLSRIQIDPVNRAVTSSGPGDVQLRINGATAETQEILSLRPEDVIRIEYHDDPGMRYGDNVAAVIDYIVRRHETGGYVAFDTQNSSHVVFGDNNVIAKLNHKNSEFSINYYDHHRRFNYWRENSEFFHYADGATFNRVEDGIPDKMSELFNRISLGYSYQEPDKWFFNASLRGYFSSGKRNTSSRLYPVDEPDNFVKMKDYTRPYSRRPSLDLYFQRTLKNKQAIILNVVGTYIDSKEERAYLENRNETTLTDIYSLTKGEKYSFIGEGIYEKGFGKGKLSLGLRHQQSITDNRYAGTSTAKTEMKEANSSVYAEYTGKLKRFNYSVGVHGSRAWFNQGSEGYTQYSFFPRVRMAYNFSDNAFIRYRGDISRWTPSLSDMGDVEQLIDSLQLRRGNPVLRMSTVYSNTLYFDYRKGLFSGNFNLYYQYQHRPIMEETLREGDIFIRTVNNQVSFQKLNPELELKFGPIKNILTLSFSNGINYFDSKGHDYRHTYTNWYYRLEAMANYKAWSGFFQVQNHRNSFFGETLSYGENYHVLGVGYRYKQLNVGVMSFNPFINTYKRGDEKFSALAPSKNWWYLKESTRVFLVNLSWNFSFGRTFQSAEKRLHNEDSSAGTLKSGK